MADTDERCGNCRFVYAEGAEPSAGLCRRYPPQAYPNQIGGAVSVFPPMDIGAGWCGEWKEKTS